MRPPLLLVLALAGCGEGQAGSRPPATTTATPPTAAVVEPTASPLAEQPRPTPLQGGDASLPFPRADDKTACTPEALRARLQGIVDKCRERSTSLCGKVTVRASEDGGGVAVGVDLGTTTGATAFVQCVTGQVNAVHWECAEPGKDLEVDLGCVL